MLESKIERYRNKSFELEIEHLHCTECDTKFLRTKHKYFNYRNEFINTAKTLDFNATECPICNNHKYDVNDLDKDAKELERIRIQTISTNNAKQLKLVKYNERLNDFWNLIAAIGKQGYNQYGNESFIASRYGMQCTRCGYIKITDDNDLAEASKSVCNKCKYKLSLKYNSSYSSLLSKLSEEIKSCLDYSKEGQKIEEADNTEDKEITMESKEASGFTRMKQRFKKYNPNMSLLAAYKVDDLQKSLICCDLCGTPKEESTHSIKNLKNFQCRGCKEQATNLNYLGLYKRDLTYTTRNGLVCYSQDGDKVDLRCNYCGERYKNDIKIKIK